MRKQTTEPDVNAFFKRNWNLIATIVLLCCLAIMLYYAYMMFTMGRDPCKLCVDMVGMTCYNAQIPTY